MGVARQINAVLGEIINEIGRKSVDGMAKYALEANGEGFRPLVRHVSGANAVKEVSADGFSATVRIEDSVEFGGKTRMKQLNDGTPDYRQPAGRPPIPIPIGYTRKLESRRLRSVPGSPPTDIIFRYFRSGVEAGEWQETNRQRVLSAVDDIVSDAVAETMR